MKRTISLLSIFVFVLAFSGSIFAQNITASANVLQEIQYNTNTTEVNFGNLENSFTTATIDPANSGNDAGVSSNAAAARVSISGASGETVLVTDPGTIQLTLGTSSDVLSLASSVTGAAGDVTTDRGGSSLTGGALALDSSGDGTLWIGGTLTPVDDGDGTIDVGTYSTTFTLTLNYQ